MASSDALQKIKAARKWRAEPYTTICRQDGAAVDMYYLSHGEGGEEQDISIGIDRGSVNTRDIAQMIVDRLNKEDKA